jgi:hypothetical protein
MPILLVVSFNCPAYLARVVLQVLFDAIFDRLILLRQILFTVHFQRVSDQALKDVNELKSGLELPGLDLLMAVFDHVELDTALAQTLNQGHSPHLSEGHDHRDLGHRQQLQ